MIGVFDSGLGGLSVLREIRGLLPAADLIYLADRGRAPYGPRSLAEVRRFSEQITDHLLASGANMIVIGCNAASAAALHHLRRRHPGRRFVGMEPAVKPAAAATRSGVIGVLTTAATFQGELFASVIDRFAADVRVETAICPGWVEAVENDSTDPGEAERMVAADLRPLLEAGADTLVLGCTHFPFLRSLVERAAGPSVTVIDPSGAVARQAAVVAGDVGAEWGGGALRVETTGDLDATRRAVRRVTGWEVDPVSVTFPP